MPTPPHQRRYLPSHSVLRSFECAARRQSFTQAAEELHLTQSAISRQVKELERAIGTDLFRRVGRRVVLTDAGRNLARDLSIDLENIRQSVLRAIAAGDRGMSLRIGVLPTFASRWLIPRLPDFSVRHPRIILNLATRLKPFDLDRERFDLAIHFGAQDWPDTKMQRLFGEEMVPVCAPAFRAAHAITHEHQIQDVPLLHLRTRPLAWANWFENAGLDERGARSGGQFDQFSMLIAGAVASLGAALLPRYMIERELGNESLVPLSDRVLETSNAYYLVAPAGSTQPHVQEFSAWLTSSVAAAHETTPADTEPAP